MLVAVHSSEGLGGTAFQREGRGSDPKQAAETPCRVVGLRSVVIDEHPAITSVAEEGAAE